jgi:hypothetical protein
MVYNDLCTQNQKLIVVGHCPRCGCPIWGPENGPNGSIYELRNTFTVARSCSCSLPPSQSVDLSGLASVLFVLGIFAWFLGLIAVYKM